MLQQTQVKTVIPYFERFMKRFSTIENLSNASLDEVLHFWTGLGYYARARNLHKAAKIITEEYQGVFPISYNEIVNLPGIGRSTAGAILSLSYEKCFPILDGNVKRVLSRYFKIEGDLNKSSTQKELWKLAEELLPNSHFNIYSQAIMDLGAIVCKKKNPNCSSCPQNKDCLAYKHGLTELIPVKVKKKEKPRKNLYWLVAIDHEGRFALQQKNQKGVWEGLWTFLEFEENGLREDYYKGLMKESNLIYEEKIKIKHSFSHYNLDIDSLILKFESESSKKLVNNQTWFNVSDLKSIGTPAPVSKIIEKVI